MSQCVTDYVNQPWRFKRVLDGRRIQDAGREDSDTLDTFDAAMMLGGANFVFWLLASNRKRFGSILVGFEVNNSWNWSTSLIASARVSGQ